MSKSIFASSSIRIFFRATRIAILCASFSGLPAALAAEYSGPVVRYFGKMVQNPNRTYDYLALTTEDGLRLLLPSEVNPIALQKSRAQVRIEGIVDTLFCTDVSIACPSGRFRQVLSIQISVSGVQASEFVRGKIRRVQGSFVEHPNRTYSYEALISQTGERYEVPPHLRTSALVDTETEVEIRGSSQPRLCTDMSAACGPRAWTSLQSVELHY